ELLDIKQEEMMAIGDMGNDIAMVDYAGLGVAMENGAENVKEISQFITKSNDDHGVAHAINKFVLKSKIED
ncbi:HAD hydrolase family protein, partial [Klebsiella pneumoniae]|uniref:HAD hydrolase family protein n=1 Tax=Klebsiella pneumoniae TaxID=573 RepID=UPI003FD41BB6